MLTLPSGADQPQFSPDGLQFVYRQAGNIWISSVHGNTPATKLARGRMPRWHPAGHALTFLRSGARELPQLWLQSLDATSEPQLLSPDGVAVIQYAWSANEQTIAIIGMDESWQSGALWLIDMNTGNVQQRWTFPAYEIPQSLAWSPDGRMLAWDVMIAPDDRTNHVVEIRLINAQEGPARHIVPVGTCQTKMPVWHPDGHTLAIVASPHPYGYQALFRLATWSVQGGIARYLTHDPVLVENAFWSLDGQTIYITARSGQITRQIYAVSVKDKTMRQLTAGLADYSRPVLSPDGRSLACAVATPHRLEEIWFIATDGSGARQMTDANQQLQSLGEIRLGAPELVRWRSVDGLELEGLLLYPPGYGPEQRPSASLPTIVDIHGGPTPITPPVRLAEHPLTLGGLHDLAAHGYLCFAADYRRSGTYGWHHLHSVIERGDYVGLDAADILAGVDHLVSTGLADPARLGLHGYSYGGFLANWLLTHTSCFRAVVSTEGMTDFATPAQVDTIRDVWMGGSPQEVPDHYRRFSPLTYAAQARTPTLLIYGQQSMMTQRQQGQRFYEALQAAGVEVELFLLPGEGHWINDRNNQADYSQRSLAWFDRHMRR